MENNQSEPKEHHYVAGFLHYEGVILLTLKLKPEWQRGFLNAIGGKIESGESSDEAMKRESKEELASRLSGDELDSLLWSKFAVLTGTNADGDLYCVHFYGCRSELVWKFCRQNGDAPKNDVGESLSLYRIDDLPNVIPNLHWLLPMMFALPLEDALSARPKYFYIEEIYR